MKGRRRQGVGGRKKGNGNGMEVRRVCRKIDKNKKREDKKVQPLFLKWVHFLLRGVNKTEKRGESEHTLQGVQQSKGWRGTKAFCTH